MVHHELPQESQAVHPGHFHVERYHIRIQRHDATGPRIIAGPRRSVQHRRRIAGADVHQIQIGIVRTGGPHLPACCAAALGFGRTRGRRAVEDPLRLAGLGINRLELPGNVVEIAGNADQHVIAHDQRRIGRPIAFLGIGDDHIPFDLAGLGVESNQVTIRCCQVHGVLIYGGSAMPDVKRLIGGVLIVPQLLGRARIDGPQMVGRGQIQDAVHQDRRCLDRARATAGLIAPHLLELAHVLRSDLRERRSSPTAVVAMKRKPRVVLPERTQREKKDQNGSAHVIGVCSKMRRHCACRCRSICREAQSGPTVDRRS